ncbi:MAG: helix-turn-helix domain-containing protein, partial [Novosphingobium sp.]
MAEQDLHTPQVPFDFPMSVGARLRLAREKQRLSRADIAARTKIAERHLAAIEEERFADLASSTYAVGFSRAYARAVGIDEREIAQAVRIELNMIDEVETPSKPTFEPGDPARVPSVRLAWVAGAAALAVVVAVVVFWGSYIFPAVSLPDLIKDAPPPAAKKVVTAAPVAAAPTAQGAVVITAKEAGVWVRITDASGKKLLEKQLAQGESFTIPADAAEPKLRTGWPDALAVTIGGQPVAPLADKRVVTTVPVSAAALLARGLPVPAPVAPQAPAQAVTAPAQTAPAPPPAATQRSTPVPAA